MTEPADASAPREITIDEALQRVVEMHRERQFEGAAELCRRILAAVPDQPDALHFQGLLRFLMGQRDEGIALVRRAIAVQPGFAGFHNNLGNLLALSDDIDGAIVEYRAAIELAPDDADAHNNLGALYKLQGRFDEAEACYRRALELQPTHMNAYNNMGLLCGARGQLEDAVGWYLKSLQQMPTQADGRKLLGFTYYALGRIREATEVFRRWKLEEPDHPVARHMYTSCAGEDTPERAPDDFVEYTFDRFADSFESQLTGKLDYRAPQLCADMLARLLPPPAGQLRMLDAGCGTGLCGPLMAPWAGVLAGVDLSRGMLDRAQTKGVYHDLYKAELTEFLRESTGHWDVVVSADTLCYFGDLQTFMTTCRTAMRGGGLLVFTVEAVPADVDMPFRLRPHGRYEHARDYLQAVLGGNGFECLAIEPQVLRTENAQPVHGWLVAARAVAAQ